MVFLKILNLSGDNLFWTGRMEINKNSFIKSWNTKSLLKYYLEGYETNYELYEKVAENLQEELCVI